MEMSPEKPVNSKKPWLVGLGIGCGAIIVIVIVIFIGGYYFVKNVTRGFKDSEKIITALQTKYGKVMDFAPDPSGAVAPDRMEAFLKVRESTAPVRARLEETLGELSKREKSLSAVRYGIGMVPQMAEYFRARGQALMDSGMGLGEYYYIYATAYFSWLKKSPEDGTGVNLSAGSGGTWGPERGRDTAEARKDMALRNINRTILPMLRNALGKADSWKAALTTEVDAMLADPHRVPWQDGLPDALRASFEPFRNRLEASYSRAANLFELFFEFNAR
jgi:hypothetical protein